MIRTIIGPSRFLGVDVRKTGENWVHAHVIQAGGLRYQMTKFRIPLRVAQTSSLYQDLVEVHDFDVAICVLQE